MGRPYWTYRVSLVTKKWTSAEDKAFTAIQSALEDIGCFLSDEALDTISRLAQEAVNHPESNVTWEDEEIE